MRPPTACLALQPQTISWSNHYWTKFQTPPWTGGSCIIYYARSISDLELLKPLIIFLNYSTTLLKDMLNLWHSVPLGSLSTFLKPWPKQTRSSGIPADWQTSRHQRNQYGRLSMKQLLSPRNRMQLKLLMVILCLFGHIFKIEVIQSKSSKPAEGAWPHLPPLRSSKYYFWVISDIEVFSEFAGYI